MLLRSEKPLDPSRSRKRPHRTELVFLPLGVCLLRVFRFSLDHSGQNWKSLTVQLFKRFKRFFALILYAMKTSTGRCKVEKLPAISSSLDGKSELTGKYKITKVQEGKVKFWQLLEAAKFQCHALNLRLCNLLLTFLYLNIVRSWERYGDFVAATSASHSHDNNV